MSAYYGSFNKFPVILPLSYYILGILIAPFLEDYFCLILFMPVISLLIFVSACFTVKAKIFLKIFSSSILFIFLGSICVLSKSQDIFIDSTFPRRIKGTIISLPKIYPHKTTFDLRTERFLDSGNEKCSKIKIIVYEKISDLDIWKEVSFLAWIHKYKNMRSSHPIKRKMEKIFGPTYVGILKSSHEIQIENAGDSRIFLINAVRKKIYSRIEKNVFSQRGIIKSILLGDKNGLQRNVKDAFRRSGLSHLLVVSGFHIGIVFAFFSFIFRFCFRRFFLSIKFNTDVPACMLAVIPTVGYALMTGLPYPTLRAVMMLLLGIVAIVYSRPLIGINIVLWVAFLISLADPFAIFSISFQMSFIAVLGIIIGIAMLRPFYLKKITSFPAHSILKQRVKLFALDLFCVTLFATIFTAPLTMYYFEGISILGLFANMFIVPLFSIFILPLGLICMILTLISFPLTTNLWVLENFMVYIANSLIESLSSLSFSFIEIKSFDLGDLIVCYLLLFGIIKCRHKIKVVISVFISFVTVSIELINIRRIG